MLEYHTYSATHSSQFLAFGSGDIDLIQPNFAAGWLNQTIDAAQQGRFAGAAQADDRHESAIGHFKAHLLKRYSAVLVNFGQVDCS